MAGGSKALSVPLRVHFLPKHAVNLDGRIGLAPAPGKQDPSANVTAESSTLDRDLHRLRDHYQANVLVTLLERGEFHTDELALLQIPELFVRAEAHGLSCDWVAMPDGGVPRSIDQLIALVERILKAVHAGQTVVVHCRDGLGRSGLTAAACLCGLGASVDEALKTVRRVRPSAVETPAQERCVRAFDEVWRRRLMRLASPTDISDVFGVPPAAKGSSQSALRVSPTGIAPLSHGGAATISYLGLTQGAREAGVSEGGPLSDGDLFHILPGGSLTLGRDPHCDVSVGSSQLSRVHTLLAYVAVAEGKLLVADLGSRNGTWIDEEQTQVRFLITGETFSLARAYRFRFESIG